MLENCAKSQEIPDVRQKIELMGEHMTEMNDSMTKLEQEGNKSTSKASCFTLGFEDFVRTSTSETNVFYAPQPAENSEKLDYVSNEESESRSC